MYNFGKMAMQVQRNPNGDIRILGKGSSRFQAIFQESFPSYTFRPFPPRYGNHDWGFFIANDDPLTYSTIKGFCDNINGAICIDDDLDACFALDYHMHWPFRTAVGTLVNAAKPYSHPVSGTHRMKCKELAQSMAAFVTAIPMYRQADYLVAVPPSRSDKDFDLPTELARAIGVLTGQTVAVDDIAKVKTTPPMKDFQDVAAKQEFLKGAFSCTGNRFRSKSILIIDDIYKSGTTLNEVARTVRQAGATKVLGLVATKTK